MTVTRKPPTAVEQMENDILAALTADLNDNLVRRVGPTIVWLDGAFDLVAVAEALLAKGYRAPYDGNPLASDPEGNAQDNAQVR